MSKISHNEMKTLKKNIQRGRNKKENVLQLAVHEHKRGFLRGRAQRCMLPGNDCFLNCLFIRLDF